MRNDDGPGPLTHASAARADETSASHAGGQP